MEIKKEDLGKFSIVIETYPGKSSRYATCKSCLEGINPTTIDKMDWDKWAKKICLIRFVPMSWDLIDKASANKYEALKILKEISPALKPGEAERAEKDIINFFLNA